MSKYQVIYRAGQAEIHAPDCRDINWEGYEGEETLAAANPYGASVEAWSHEKTGSDLLALAKSVFFPCLAPTGAASSVDIPEVGLRATLAEKIETTTDWAERHGWGVVDQGQSLEMTRGDEFIVAVWDINRWDGSGSAWTYDGRSVRLPALADALRRIAGEPEDVPEPGERRAPRRRPTKRSIPFDIEEDDDDTILDAVVGGTLIWVNSFTGGEESACVPPDGETKRGAAHNTHLSIAESSAGRRILTFVDYMGTGFRSVALDALVAVK